MYLQNHEIKEKNSSYTVSVNKTFNTFCQIAFTYMDCKI